MSSRARTAILKQCKLVLLTYCFKQIFLEGVYDTKACTAFPVVLPWHIIPLILRKKQHVCYFLRKLLSQLHCIAQSQIHVLRVTLPVCHYPPFSRYRWAYFRFSPRSTGPAPTCSRNSSLISGYFPGYVLSTGLCVNGMILLVYLLKLKPCPFPPIFLGTNNHQQHPLLLLVHCQTHFS